MKSKTAAEKRHHARVGEMSCLTCGRYGVHVHHVTSDGFQRITRDHKRVVPLCPYCHQHGPLAVHKIGAAEFNREYSIDLLAEADRLWSDANG